MRRQIEALVTSFETGGMTRRQLVGNLAALVGLAAGGAGGLLAQPPAEKSTFEAFGVHHLALKVTDLDRSQSFYERHLGLKPMAMPGVPPFMRFMACPSPSDCWSQTHVLNLWKAEAPGLHHVCFAVSDYDQKSAVEKLRAENLSPEQRGNSRVLPGSRRLDDSGRRARRRLIPICCGRRLAALAPLVGNWSVGGRKGADRGGVGGGKVLRPNCESTDPR